MKYSYIIPPGYYGLHRPFVPVILKYQNEQIPPILTLIDTGVDYCTFEREVGESLGIDVTSGRRDTMIGIGSIEYPVYLHNITLSIGGFAFRTEVAFSDTSDIPPIPVLGQIGFFENFKVFFNYPQGIFYVKPAPPNINDPWPTP